jgi:hypothetical protein
MPLRSNRARRLWIFASVDDSPQALWIIIAYFSRRPQGKAENGHTNGFLLIFAIADSKFLARRTGNSWSQRSILAS